MRGVELLKSRVISILLMHFDRHRRKVVILRKGLILCHLADDTGNNSWRDVAHQLNIPRPLFDLHKPLWRHIDKDLLHQPTKVMQDISSTYIVSNSFGVDDFVSPKHDFNNVSR